MSDLEALENARAGLLRRIKIVKFLGLFESFIFFFLTLILLKDFIIALAVAIVLGIFFFRFFTQKLFKHKNIIEARALELFLKKNSGKFRGDLNIDFSEILGFKPLNLRISNGLEFQNFTIFDALFQNEARQAFVGVLIKLKSTKAFKDDLRICPFDEVFIKLKNKDFSVNKIFIKENFALISSLKNPFFIDPRENLSQNFTKMQKNLNDLNDLIIKI